MARDNITKYVILGLLTHEPRSGYDIKKHIEHTIGYFWSDISYGQIYPILGKLEEDGLATKEIEMHEDGPNRKIYTITEKGREIFRKWLRKPANKEVIKYEVLMKLFFGYELPVAENIEKIRAFQAKLSQYTEMMGLYEENLRQVLEQDSDHLYFLLVVRFGQYFYEAAQKWTEEAIQLLEQSDIQGGTSS
jgi:DNA-binding PadR family transcriptional regulator